MTATSSVIAYKQTRRWFKKGMTLVWEQDGDKYRLVIIGPRGGRTVTQTILSSI